jgi:hypothetical protein
MGGEEHPVHRPLRSYLVWAATAIQLELVAFLVVPTAVKAKVFLIAFICCSPAIQLPRVPVILRMLRRAGWEGHADNAAWVDWFVSLFTGAAAAICLADFACRKLACGYYWAESDAVLPAMQQYARRSLLGGVGSSGFSWQAFVWLFEAIIVLDIVILWRFARFRPLAFKPSVIAALAADAVVYGSMALVVLTPIAVDWIRWELGWELRWW